MRSILTPLFITALLAGCGGGGAWSPEPEPVTPAAVSGSARIGVAGGTLDAGEARFEVPAGALAADVTIALSEGDAGAPPLPRLPANVRTVGAPLSLQPHGTGFAGPAMLSLKRPALAADEQLIVLQTNAANTGWQQLPSMEVGDTVRVAVSHFSTVRLLSFCGAPECVVGPPEIAMQPASGSVDEGGYVLLSVEAIGLSPFTYQWRRDGVVLDGQTSQGLVVQPVALADDGMRLSVVVTDRLGRSTTSEAGVVRVRPVAPRVATQPDDVQAVEGGGATFLAGTTSGVAQTLQWQRSIDGGGTWADVPAPANRARLELTAVRLADDGALFRLLASNSAGSVRTRAVRLSVQAAPGVPVIVTPPADVATVPGRSVDFGFTASGGGLRTTWERSVDGLTWETVGTDLQLTLANADPADHGTLVRATVSNAAGSATSAPARLSVALVPGAAPVRLAAGSYFSLALAADGGVLAWGDNTGGQLGRGDIEPHDGVHRIDGLTGAATLSAGRGHALALLANGQVRGWGWNDRGQVAADLPEHVTRPVAIGSGNSNGNSLAGRGVAAGHTFSLLLQTLGSPLPTWTWGGGDMLDGTRRDVSGGGWNRAPWTIPPAPPYGMALDGPPVRAASVSWDWGVLLRSDGSVMAWGWGDYGQLGPQAYWGSSSTPVLLPDLRRIVRVAAGSYHGVALDDVGRVFAWGSNDLYLLGVPAVTDRIQLWPVEVPLPSPAIEVAAGENFTIALLADGRVFAWGRNLDGQIGQGVFGGIYATPQPVLLPPELRFVAVAAGDRHGLALDAQGDVWAWGGGASGQLGQADRRNRHTPVRVPGVNLD